MGRFEPQVAYRVLMRGRAIIVHSLAHARLALAAAEELHVPVTLLSAPGAGAYLGALGFRELAALATAEHPNVQATAVLDCGDRAGPVLRALDHGIATVRFTGPRRVAQKLSDLAAQRGAHLITGRIPALDLLDEVDPASACRAWLAGYQAHGENDRD